MEELTKYRNWIVCSLTIFLSIFFTLKVTGHTHTTWQKQLAKFFWKVDQIVPIFKLNNEFYFQFWAILDNVD